MQFYNKGIDLLNDTWTVNAVKGKAKHGKNKVYSPIEERRDRVYKTMLYRSVQFTNHWKIGLKLIFLELQSHVLRHFSPKGPSSGNVTDEGPSGRNVVIHVIIIIKVQINFSIINL